MKTEQDAQRIYRLPESPGFEPGITAELFEIYGNRPGIMVGQTPIAMSGNERLNVPPVPRHGAFRYAGVPEYPQIIAPESSNPLRPVVIAASLHETPSAGILSGFVYTTEPRGITQYTENRDTRLYISNLDISLLD